MALRNQPYIPLYVQDVLTDEKLIECSAEAHGVYFRLICILHKQEEYGKLELKAKYKQTNSKSKNFAIMLNKQMPFPTEIIEKSITELIDERVLTYENDYLVQKRMVKDFALSKMRAEIGSKGGKKGRNSGTKRYYNEEGYLYLLYDNDDKEAFKIGISADPEKRIKGISRKSGRKNLAFRRKWKVSDMGETEEFVLNYYNDIRDGEWIFGSYHIEEIETTIESLINKSKTKANTEYEIENENEVENKNGIELVYPFQSEKFKTVWSVLVKEPKWKKKTKASLQACLKKLSKHSEQDAIQMIENTIAGGWQGLFELNKSKQNGKSANEESRERLLRESLNILNS